MSNLTDQINLFVNINGSAAQNQLNELRKRSVDLTAEILGLKKGTAEWIAKTSELKGVTDKMSNLKKEIGLTSLSLKELASERRKLNSLMLSAMPGTVEFKKYEAELVKVISRQNQLKRNISGLNNVSFSKLNSSISTLAAGYLGITAVISGIKSLATGAIKLSDQLGDLRRVVGLTKDEANGLNQQLLKIDTRTSGAGLLSIAIIAGKLGVAKEDIVSFTEAVDKLVITLGDELGDADEITTQLGKILNVFDGKVTGDNISYLGNAIVDLANKGLATGGFIVDFTQRVSGIAKASNLSLAATLGLAAGLESLGLRSESSSTALQKLLSTIGTNMPKAAKIAGVPLKEFNQLFADKPQEALLKYAEGLTKNKKSFAEVTSSFKDAGQEGARVVQTMLALGQESGYLREQMDIANTSIKEQNALNDGAAIKQENLAGSIDRLGKAWDRLVANEKVTSFLKGIVDVLSGAVDGVNYLIDSFDSLEEARDKLNKKHDQDQDAFGFEIAHEMAKKTLDDQQKLADSYKAIYINSQKELSAFLKSGNSDLKERNRLLDQQNQDEKVYFATQKQLAKAIEEQKKKTKDGSTESGAPKSNNSEYKRLKKEAEKFYADIKKLKGQALMLGKSDDEKELAALQAKYAELHDKALEFFRKNITDRKTYNAEEKAIIEAFQLELKNLQSKQFDETSKEDYAQALEDTRSHFENQRNIAGKNYADGLTTKKEYDAKLLQLDQQEKAQLVMVAEQYVKTVTKAEADVTKFKADQEKQQTTDAIAAAETRKEIAKQEALAKAQLAVISAPKGSKREDKAKEDLLVLQFDQDVAELGLNNRDELYKFKEAQLQEALDQIDADGKQRRIQAAKEFAQDVLNIMQSLVTTLGNLDQRELNRDKAKNDAKKNNYKKQLDGKLLSQKHYDAKVTKADEELAKKKHEIDLKTFKRQQALAITGALINGAMAITSTLAARPGLADIFTLGAARAIQVGLVIATTLGQVAAIASQSPPEAAEGNWFRKGPKHKDPEKGIHVLIERDEAVVKADAMTDNKTYTVTGTPSQITSKLNSMHGGIGWSTGAILTPKFRDPGPRINFNMPRIMAQGGLIHPIRTSDPNHIDLYEKMLIAQGTMIEEVQEMRKDIKNQNSELHAVVSIKEFRRKEKVYDNARKSSGMNQ